MTSSNGHIFHVTGPLCGQFTAHRWISPQRPVTRSFDVFFDPHLNKRLSKQSWFWWFETPSRPLWRHCHSIISIHRQRGWVPPKMKAFKKFKISNDNGYIMYNTSQKCAHGLCLVMFYVQTDFTGTIHVFLTAWWRHQMETFSALLAICARNSPVPGEFPTQRPVTRTFDVFFDLRPNKRLSKQWWGWWFETLSHPL